MTRACGFESRPDRGWNMCVNLLWQTCAIKGLLHGQGGRLMHFSIAPRDLDVGVFERPSQCVSGSCSDHYAISVRGRSFESTSAPAGPRPRAL